MFSTLSHTSFRVGPFFLAAPPLNKPGNYKTQMLTAVVAFSQIIVTHSHHETDAKVSHHHQ